MKGFKTEDSYKAMYYMLEHPKFISRSLSEFYGWPFGGKVVDFVNWLVDLKLVRKTHETEKGKPRYEVASRAELVNFYSKYRDLNKKIIQTYEIAIDRKSAIKLIGKNGGILCLTTALELYGDEYFQDPTIHAYSADPNLLPLMEDQEDGNTKIILYEYDLADEIKQKKNVPVTSPNRTIIDLFCANLAYAVERFLPKVWLK
ncbi:MAG: hypothetical protein OEM28_11640 [Nitrosopumilus sp.]|nr:hypothetical protein [Nitrosopumilus sp.]MDH3488480.1 hypothetical protein [Nitrosopumilus sp.]